MRVLNHQLSQCICCFGCSLLYLLSFEDGQFSSLILLIAVQSFEDVSPKPCKLDKLLSCVLNSVGLLFTRLVWFFSSNFQHSAKTLCCLLFFIKEGFYITSLPPTFKRNSPLRLIEFFEKSARTNSLLLEEQQPSPDVKVDFNISMAAGTIHGGGASFRLPEMEEIWSESQEMWSLGAGNGCKNVTIIGEFFFYENYRKPLRNSTLKVSFPHWNGC